MGKQGNLLCCCTENPRQMAIIMLKPIVNHYFTVMYTNHRMKRCGSCAVHAALLIKSAFPTVILKKERETLFCFASTNRLSFKKSASSLANRVFVYVTARKYRRAACREVLSEPIKKKDQSRLDKKKSSNVNCPICRLDKKRALDWTKIQILLGWALSLCLWLQMQLKCC